MESPNSAVILVDFENVYYHFQNSLKSAAAGGDVGAEVMKWLEKLRAHITEELKEPVVSVEAYADFDQLDAQDIQSDLYLLGAETHHVLGTDRKNAADMKLCVDAMEILYTRPSVEIFTIVAGDRDYIPVIRHLKKAGKKIRVVAFPKTISGDLLKLVGRDNYLNGEMFFEASAPIPGQEPLPSPAAEIAAAATAAAAGNAAASSLRAPSRTSMPAEVAGLREPRPEDHDAMRESAQNALEALAVMIHHYGAKPVVFLGPFLRTLRSELPLITEEERRATIAYLVREQLVSLIKRDDGKGGEYTVLEINWARENVKRVHKNGEEILRQVRDRTQW